MVYLDNTSAVRRPWCSTDIAVLLFVSFVAFPVQQTKLVP